MLEYTLKKEKYINNTIKLLIKEENMLVYVYFYDSYVMEDYELTLFKSCAKKFKTKKEINYYLKVLKLKKYDIKIINEE